MHRMTPLTQGFVAFSGGGARALVDTVNDSPMMQEMKGSFYQGEARGEIESPQNYGYTSVVRPAKKNAKGEIMECAEAFMSFLSGNRSLPIAAIMDDRRFRPMGLKPGETAQYDDLGQMTLLRRVGLFLLTNDNEEESTDPEGSKQSGEKKKPERMVSLRHVEKKKQERPKPGQPEQPSTGGGIGSKEVAPEVQAEQEAKKKEDFKHEGESVNTEIRATKKDIQIFDGETMVAKYDRGSGEWTFKSKKITLDASDTFEIKSKTIKITATGTLDLYGKPIKANGGGTVIPPFTVS